MAKWKKYSIQLSQADIMDVKLETENNVVVGFALNYRTKIGGKFFEVYRVDTAHGYLHEQKYWVSHEPIPIALMESDLRSACSFYYEQIKQNFERYKKYYLESIGKE